jgi:hypothetical protein
MSVLRFASLVVLAVWVGGLAALGTVAAPAIFTTLESQDPSGGRALAATIFGAVFMRFQHGAWILGGILLVLLIVRAVLGPRPRPFALRIAAVTTMLAASLAAGLVVAPRIEAIRRETTGAVAALAESDARRVAFGRLHGLSNGLMGLTLLVGVWLLWAEMHDTH